LVFKSRWLSLSGMNALVFFYFSFFLSFFF